MRLRILQLPALAVGLLLLDAPLPAQAGACTAGQCLSNGSVAQRLQPTSVTTDDKGDVTFFASQSGQLPNVVFILDNSTSMNELPYDLGPFPNTGFISKGVTPVGSGLTLAATVAGCHSNTFFEALKDGSGNLYTKATTYPVPDSAFSTYFTNANVYRYMEWTSASPGGSANGTDPTPKVGGGAAVGTPTTACSAMSTTASSGGSGGSGLTLWTMTQQQRCQQCVSEAGYYIKPGTSGSQSDVQNGSYVFKGNWLNFYPPKFIIGRKALTDFITKQSSTPTPVRVGVVTYDNNNTNALDVPSATTGLRANDGGAFISSGMVPDCNVVTWTGSATITQQTALLSAVRAVSFGSFSSSIATPLAETLFNVGQFFTGDNAYYTTNFGANWIKSGFTAPSGASKPLCVSCQVNAVVLITDGAPFGDNNLPAKFRTNSVDCTGCGTDGFNNTPNLLDDVSNFLATTDLNTTQAGIQDVVTFVIGMGIKVPLLDNAAKFGKSSAALRADNAQDLQDAVTSAVVNIVARATAFSSTAIQTLEVGTGSTAFVPRFVPGSPTDPIWEGHLFRFDLFNEFVAGVDKDANGDLNGVFLVDKDGDIITEDDKGAFHKKKNNAPAVPVWDGGAQLTATPANSRIIYTAIFDSSTTPGTWTTIPLPSATTDANFAAVVTALHIDDPLSGLTLANSPCKQIKAAMATPIPARYLNILSVFDRDHCALAILDYVRGLNILNDNPTSTSTTINRAHMLGDIFHSSPVVVDPPVDQFICSLGLHSQCISTLYGYQNSSALIVATPSEDYVVTVPRTETIQAYEKYWRDHESRQRIVLVGANDGMVHAFDAGSPTTSPPTLNANVGFRQVVYTAGTGNELWAFVPPDQLPRLWNMLRDGHQLYMDGDIMVRDIWVDGKKNDKGTSSFSDLPGIKQDVEYHTVAIASERQGGSHFVALDVTDTTVPKMLWIYPPPCSEEEAIWGQTWGQFSPRPPPVGPVLLKTDNTGLALTAGPPNYGSLHTAERWIAFLNGGHSPFGNRGRAAALVDAFTGSALFLAKYSDLSADATKPKSQLKFGFPATGALVDYGIGSTFAQDGFFDTAVVGDEGGQIWTFRFGDPGALDASGRATNWTFARAYEPKTSATTDPRFHQPIFTVASTTVQEDNGWLRAFVGSGDRAHVRSQGGGDCRPDDPMTCISAGCTVNSSMVLDNGPTRYTATFTSGTGTSGASPVMGKPTQLFDTTTISANLCDSAAASETVAITACPSSAMNFSEPLSFTCTGTPASCTETAFAQPTPNGNRAAAASGISPNSFVSVAILADTVTNGASPAVALNSRRMNVLGDEGTYDANRLTSADLVDVTQTTFNAVTGLGSTAATSAVATRTSAGWAVKYPTIDEKTVTSSTILGGCVIWSSLIPGAGAVGCASAGSTLAPFYQSDALTGAPNCASSFLGVDTSGVATGTKNYVRFIQRNVLSPPPEPAAAVAVGSGGTSMRFSTLEIQPGASEVTQMTVNTSTEMLQMLYSVPLTVEQHQCRHVSAAKCP
jgi:type IV pilus assembly protein PilY1